MENGLYTAHEVAVILADAFGDDCACNFNGNDEWLPYLCELQEIVRIRAELLAGNSI